jgi:hypothetical protein
MKIAFTLSITDICVTLACLILIIIANVYGDSSKKTAWMFFLWPLGAIIAFIYWIVRLFT